MTRNGRRRTTLVVLLSVVVVGLLALYIQRCAHGVRVRVLLCRVCTVTCVLACRALSLYVFCLVCAAASFLVLGSWLVLVQTTIRHVMALSTSYSDTLRQHFSVPIKRYRAALQQRNKHTACTLGDQCELRPPRSPADARVNRAPAR